MVDLKKRLYRSKDERMLAGVCGGIGEYLEVDPTLIRLAAVLLAFAGGPGFIAYIVLWLIVPERPVEDMFAPDTPSYDESA